MISKVMEVLGFYIVVKLCHRSPVINSAYNLALIIKISKSI